MLTNKNTIVASEKTPPWTQQRACLLPPKKRTWKIHQIPPKCQEKYFISFPGIRCLCKGAWCFGPKGYGVLWQTLPSHTAHTTGKVTTQEASKNSRGKGCMLEEGTRGPGSVNPTTFWEAIKTVQRILGATYRIKWLNWAENFSKPLLNDWFTNFSKEKLCCPHLLE